METDRNIVCVYVLTKIVYAKTNHEMSGNSKLKNILEQLWRRSRCFVGVNPRGALSAGLLLCKVGNVKMRVLPDYYLLRNPYSEITWSKRKFVLEQVDAAFIVRAL